MFEDSPSLSFSSGPLRPFFAICGWERRGSHACHILSLSGDGCLMITFPSHRQMPIGGFVYQTGHASQAGRDWRGVEAKIPIKWFFQISWREICTTWQLAALVSWTLFGLSLGSSWTHGLGTISSPSSLIFSPIDAREHPWPLWQCSQPSIPCR